MSPKRSLMPSSLNPISQGIYLCRRYTSPIELTAHFLTGQNTHKFLQYNQQGRLKKHSVSCCVAIDIEDRKIIASSTRSNERRQGPGPSVNFREEMYTNGDLRNKGQALTRSQVEDKTQAERLKLQPENWKYRPHTKVISR